MTQKRGGGWPTTLTKVIGQQVARWRLDPWRKNPDMSARELAEGVEGLGVESYSRSQVANLETGRRSSVTVGELLAIAATLEVSPLQLLFPVGIDEQVEVLPGVRVTPWEAAKWFTGEEPLPGWEDATRSPTIVGGGPQRWRRFTLPVRLYREHEQELQARDRWSISTDDDDRRQMLNSEFRLRRIREHMRDFDIIPPALPPELAHIDREETS
jgi:transcriptional regulator with XRE-family HTH domain